VSSQSPNKRLDPKTGKGRELLQKELDDLASVFISDVARNRGVGIDTVQEKFGQGGLLIASEAIKFGMADELNSLEGIVSKLKNVSYSQIGETLMSSAKESLIEAAKEGDLISSNSLENNSGTDTPLPPSAAAIDEAKLLAGNAKLYHALIQKGAMQERERIKAIDAMSLVVENKNLLEEAKYINPCSAEQLAYKIVKAESDAGRKFSADYADDKAALNGISATTEISGSTQFDADVLAIVKGVKGNG
jgi:ClpP class serine protease